MVSSSEPSIHLEEDASKQGRNEIVGSGEANELDDNDAVGLDGTRLDTGMASGEAMENNREVDGSGDNAQGFVVADRAGHEVILEEFAKTQEKVVEKLKTLEPEQLVKATRELGSALRGLSEVVKDSTAEVDAAASGKSNVD